MSNYYLKSREQLAKLNKKASLLIHICCGVCSVYPLVFLRQYFNITIYFANSNIYPYDEYQKRLKALQEYLAILNDESIKLIVAPYDNVTFTRIISKHKDEPEGGKRCYLCYSLRMEETFAYAQQQHYDYCTTVMSISNRKNADYINQIGEELQKKYPGTTYLYADFKKGDGITFNERMNKELNLYHQNYCGCIFSKR